ncbi:ganglioside-induced differentiation-associated protein 1-like [Tropilaelaps mercedesae]|uniref:Ganglioside-induced differentiation-associated protein 1-like n=1 Tax=Tropilaelaps mercedesae TaxID=418985 RepID=A0A1V9XTR2_9ACAR|nr:ganglioside-induced differentiation-associated protein 1-like [Tropilaelaps mercedesae]
MPYKESYDYKFTKLNSGRAMLTEESAFVAEIESTKEVLHRINKQVIQSSGSWLFSDFLTVADITLTVILFRLRKLGLEHHFFEDGQGQPALQHLAAYAKRAFEQPYMKGALC